MPGEADSFCAAAARTAHGRTVILTNDSDLLVHDLGMQGDVVFLNQIRLCVESGNKKHLKGCEAIRVNSFSMHSIAQRVGFKDFTRLAFEIRSHPSTTLHAAVERMTEPVSDATAFEDFLHEYQEVSSPPLRSATQENPVLGHQHERYLDPRISELIVQVTSDKTGIPPVIYLPVLIEDPLRTSAWVTSTDHRTFAYSCLRFCIPIRFDHKAVQEVFRKGDRIGITAIDTLNESETVAYASLLLREIHETRIVCGNDIGPYRFWRWYAVSQVWTSDMSEEARFSMLKGTEKATFWTWQDVQLDACVQAMLYSLRTVRQILNHLNSMNTSLPKSLIELDQVMSTLPPLKVMMTTRLETLERGEEEKW